MESEERKLESEEIKVATEEIRSETEDCSQGTELNNEKPAGGGDAPASGDEKPQQRKAMFRGFLFGVIAATLVVLIGTAVKSVTGMGVTASDPASNATYEKISEVEGVIDRNYMGEIDKQKMTDYLFLGMVSGLEDPYSTYYTKEEYDSVNAAFEGEFDGIGVTIGTSVEDGLLYIQKVYEDSPADIAGVQPGDRVDKINGIDVTGFTPNEAVEIIAADEDKVVELTVTRIDGDNEEQIDFEITKDKIEIKSVSYKMLEDHIGYIEINSFTEAAARQFTAALEDLRAQGMEGLVIDLRDDLGGRVNACINMLSEITPKGILVYTIDASGKRTDYENDEDHTIDVPLAVLVNEMTASASEIFAGAVQDKGIGTIIGTQTYGKGIVQDMFRLKDESVVKLTVAHYYTPNGNDIHKKGITPDIVVEDINDQLDAAIEAVSGE